MEKLKIISGTSNSNLASGIVNNLGKKLSDINIEQFADDEIFVQIQESVRGSDVFVIQSTSNPGNYNLMELLIIIDALRRASASRITAVIPYFGYARQDRKDRPRVAITAKLVANLIVKAGADRILTLDLHTDQLQGFFDIPVDHLYSTPVFVDYIKENYKNDLCVVAPDTGSVDRARLIAKELNATIAIIDKRRPKPNETEIMNVIGDVKGMDLIIVDDIVDTAGTLTKAVEVLKEQGANKICSCCTHAVLSKNAVKRIEESKMDELVVTDSIFQDMNNSRIKKLTVAKLFSEAIDQIHKEGSVATLFR